MDDLTSTNVATIASSESPWSTWKEKQPSNIYQNWPKIESKKTAHSHIPHLLVQRGKSQNRFSPAAPDRQGASDTWLTTINGIQKGGVVKYAEAASGENMKLNCVTFCIIVRGCVRIG